MSNPANELVLAGLILAVAIVVIVAVAQNLLAADAEGTLTMPRPVRCGLIVLAMAVLWPVLVVASFVVTVASGWLLFGVDVTKGPNVMPGITIAAFFAVLAFGRALWCRYVTAGRLQ
jgi:hypothetical protein